MPSNISDFKAALRSLTMQMVLEKNSANSQIIKKFKEKYPEMMEENRNLIIEIGLRRLINGYTKKIKIMPLNQGDFFTSGQADIVISVKDGNGKLQRIRQEDAKLAQLIERLEAKRDKRAFSKKDQEMLSGLKELVDKNGSDDVELGVAIKAIKSD